MNIQGKHGGEIILYKGKDGESLLEVKLEKETVWLTYEQMAFLYKIDRTVIVKHVQNVYKSGELKPNSTCAKIAHTGKDGRTRKANLYNLDMIISVGYRVNSKRATEFRKWATSVLRDHILEGYTVNQKRLQERGLDEFEKAVGLIKKTVLAKQLTENEAKGLLDVITDYSQTWLLLQKYDEGELQIGRTKKAKKKVTYDDAVHAIMNLKSELVSKKEAGDIFGNERENGLDRILGSIYQTFEGKELYQSLEEKAAHLLYFIIKDHPFSDGNKRIGSFLFIVFLAKNGCLYKKSGERRINDNALVALALLTAESNPKDKEMIVKLIVNLLQD